jgi:type II restriction/modification system DNA methylase subunit YeeA
MFPYENGLSITRRPTEQWIIDFGEMSKEAASLYEKPFGFVLDTIHDLRVSHREPRQKEKWWLSARSCPEMKAAVGELDRFLVTPTVCKHRVFAWLSSPTNPDHQLYVFARADDFFLGIVHSKLHEVWARAQGTQVRERQTGFRYTPTTCFETFPFPEASPMQQRAIGEAAKRLSELRTNWLNPPRMDSSGIPRVSWVGRWTLGKSRPRALEPRRKLPCRQPSMCQKG